MRLSELIRTYHPVALVRALERKYGPDRHGDFWGVIWQEDTMAAGIRRAGRTVDWDSEATIDVDVCGDEREGGWELGELAKQMEEEREEAQRCSAYESCDMGGDDDGDGTAAAATTATALVTVVMPATEATVPPPPALGSSPILPALTLHARRRHALLTFYQGHDPHRAPGMCRTCRKCVS